MPITSTWTTPSSLDRAINDILTETIWDNLVSNVLYLYDSVHQFPWTIGIGDAPLANVGAMIRGIGLSGASQYGVLSDNAFSSGATTAGYAVYARLQTAASAFTLANGFGVYVETPIKGAGSALTQATGVYVGPQTQGANANYGVYVQAPSGGSVSNYGVFIAGGAPALVIQAGGATITGTLLMNGGAVSADTATAGNNIPVRIAESVLGGTAASISFTSIPSTFRHLQVVMTARGDTAAQNIIINLRFNNDTGNNYDLQSLVADNTTITGGSSVGVSAIDLFRAPAASATASKFGHATFTVGAYKATDQHKEVVGHSHSSNAGTAAITYNAFSGRWASTAAINRLDVFPAAGNFVAGTTVTLYGLP